MQRSSHTTPFSKVGKELLDKFRGNASLEQILAFAGERLKDFDAFAFSVFGSQMWKKAEPIRDARLLREIRNTMKEVLRAAQPLLKTFDARNLVSRFAELQS
jgi:hypothetical protein